MILKNDDSETAVPKTRGLTMDLSGLKSASTQKHNAHHAYQSLNYDDLTKKNMLFYIIAEPRKMNGILLMKS